MDNLSQNNYSKPLLETIKYNRLGIGVVLLMLQSCIGSIAAGFVFTLEVYSAQLITLGLISFTTMGANAAIIALAPMKWILRLFVLSIIVSIGCFIYALL